MFFISGSNGLIDPSNTAIDSIFFIVDYISDMKVESTQRAITCSKSTIEALEQGVNYVQS